MQRRAAVTAGCAYCVLHMMGCVAGSRAHWTVPAWQGCCTPHLHHMPPAAVCARWLTSAWRPGGRQSQTYFLTARHPPTLITLCSFGPLVDMSVVPKQVCAFACASALAVGFLTFAKRIHPLAQPAG